MVLFGIGSNPLQIQIEIQPNQNSLQSKTIIPLDHSPNWRVSKNVFMSALSKQTLQNVIRKNNTAVMQVHPHQPVVAEPQFGGMPQQQQLQPIIYAHSETEDVQGVVHLMLPPGKHFEHAGIKIQFVGRIEMSHAIYEGKSHYDFISSTKELQPPTTLYQTSTTIPFYFRADDQKPYESYHGRNVAVKYFVRVIVERSNKFLMPPIKYDQEVVFQIVKQEPRLNQPIKMEVGIEECLHIEFQYKKRYYHLNDVIEGDIHFLLVRIKIKYMELAVIRRETSGEGLSASAVHAAGLTGATPDSSAGTVTETQTLTRFEIMDGAPVKGEIIPVRLYLSGIPADLTPTFDTPGSRFAVRYYLNLVLVDEEDRRYFKQQEIILWRKDLG